MWKVKMGDHHTPKLKVAATLAVINANTNMKNINPLLKKPKDRVAAKVSLTEINEYIMCQLCSGYLIDATAIIECQHTFCKSCILKYLETNSYCPICDVQLNKANPHSSMRSDAILQKLVYKMVPGLFVSEIRRRKDFARKFPSDSVSGTVVELDAAEDLCVLSPDDAVSLSLEYFKSDEDSSSEKKQQPQTTNSQQQKQQALQSPKKSTCSDKRFLQCPAAVSVGLLKKFIRMKYGLLDDYRVDLLYNGDRDSIVENDLTLLDLAFIFKWNKDEPMPFHYRIFDRPVKSVSPRPGTKRPAPSMMDEPPPDDDAASGPANRSSMASASPSKLPRISESGTSNNNTGNTNNNANTSSSANTCAASSSTLPTVVNKTESSSSSSSSAATTTTTQASTQKSSKGHSSHSNNIKTKKRKSKQSPVDNNSSKEISPSTMSRRSMSATANNNNNNRNNSPVTRASRVSVSAVATNAKKEHEESKTQGKATTTTAATVSAQNSKLQKQQSVTTKVNSNNGSLKLSISTANVSPVRETLKISLGSIAKEKSHNHSSHEKRHHHHHHRKHKLKKEKNREKKEKKDKDRDKSSKHANKQIKLSLNLNNLKASSGSLPISSSSNSNSSTSNSSSSHSSNGNNQNQSQNQSQQFCSVKDASVGSKQQTNSKGGGAEKDKGKSQNQTAGNKTGKISNKNSGLDIQNRSSSSSSSCSTNHHPLLPDSVQVPKSVTLIPVPAPGKSGNTTSTRNTSDKNNSTRLNSHTFTHPITNKSLHQITVTEVPPPQQKPPTATSNSSTNTNNNGSSNNVCPPASNANQSVGGGSGSASSLEKAIVSGGNGNKPQFSGPGSMEITKIFSSTSGSKVFDISTAKKLKERKGLDISISGTSLSVVENYRQNVTNTATNQNTSTTNANKAKSAAAALLSGKMPPGITIGPANTMATNSNRQTDPSKGGLTFTIPHHVGATTPGNLPGLRNIGVSVTTPKVSDKNSNKKESNSSNSNNNNSGNGKSVTRTPPPPQQQQQQSSRKAGDSNLSAMFDIRASPSPPKEKNSSSKDPPSNNNANNSSTSTSNNSNGFKRSFDVSSHRRNHLSTSATSQSQRDSPGPERKRDRSNSNSSRPSSSSAPDHDSPLDLSGKSSRSEHSTATKSDISFPKGTTRPPTPVPKSVSPLHSTGTGKSSKESTSHHHHHQTNKNSPNSTTNSSKSSSPISNPSQNIHSIAQTLHHKQQQNQFLQQHQLGIGLSQQQQTNQKSNASKTSPHGNHTNLNSNNNSGYTVSPLDSLSSQIIPMSAPSPTGTTGFNSLRMLADATLLHKMHPMNSLMAAVGLCTQTQPPMPHSAPGSSVSNQLSPGLFSQGAANIMNPGKSMGPPHGLLDPSNHHNIFAALQNQNLANGRVGGMVGNPFGSSLSPPLYFPTNRPSAPLPPPSMPTSLRIPNVTPKLPVSSLKSPSSSLHSSLMTPPHLYPSLSPTSPYNKGKSSSPSPPAISVTPVSSSLTNSLNATQNSRSSNNSSSIQNPSSAAAAAAQRSLNQKMNGMLSAPCNSVPILPPGFHNPLSRISSSLSTHSYHANSSLNSTLNTKSTAPTASPVNTKSPSHLTPTPITTKSPNISSLSSLSNNKLYTPPSSLSTSSASKGGIPASMKISNFLPPPNKSNPNNSTSNSQATITSASSISSSLARFLNSLPPLIPPSQQISAPSLSLLPPFSQPIPTTKATDNIAATNNNKAVVSSELNSKCLGKTHSTAKIGSLNVVDNNRINSSKQTKDEQSSISSFPSSATLSDKMKLSGAATTAFGAPMNLNLGLGMGSPPPSARTTQPQNQAVRHIPNPCLLFNRQNSSGGGTNNNVNINVNSHNNNSSAVPTMTLSSYTPPSNNESQHDSSDGKKSPLVSLSIPARIATTPSPTMPLQVHHPMLSLFPGVSVPFKVEVPAVPTETIKEELPRTSSSSPQSPPPVKKAKLEVDRPQSACETIQTATAVVPVSHLQDNVKEETPVVNAEQGKQEINVDIPSKKELEISQVENNENKVKEDDDRKDVKETESVVEVSEEDLKRKTSDGIQLENEDNSKVEIVDVVSVDSENESKQNVMVVEEKQEEVISSVISAPEMTAVETGGETATGIENSENSENSEKNEKEEIPVSVLVKEEVAILQTAVVLDVKEAEVVEELKVTVAEVKSNVKCEKEREESVSEMEIDVVGDEPEIEVDVGVDEPMEISSQGILQSLKNDENTKSLPSNDDDEHQPPNEEKDSMIITEAPTDMEITSESSNEMKELIVAADTVTTVEMKESSEEEKQVEITHQEIETDMEKQDVSEVTEEIVAEIKAADQQDEKMDIHVCNEQSESISQINDDSDSAKDELVMQETEEPCNATVDIEMSQQTESSSTDSLLMVGDMVVVNEEAEVKIKNDMPVENVDTGVAAAAAESTGKDSQAEFVQNNETVEREMNKEDNGIEDVEKIQEEQPAAPLHTIQCVELPAEKVAATNNYVVNIIQMSQDPLTTEETPTVSPCINNLPDPITINVTEEAQVEHYPVNDTNANCNSATSPVTIAIPCEGEVTVATINSHSSETIDAVATTSVSVCSPNSEGSSSSLSSPSSVVGVGVGVQRVDLKKMENLEKVAAGLLATANMNMGTININNNNNSIAPANCDITISAANHC